MSIGLIPGAGDGVNPHASTPMVSPVVVSSCPDVRNADKLIERGVGQAATSSGTKVQTRKRHRGGGRLDYVVGQEEMKDNNDQEDGEDVNASDGTVLKECGASECKDGPLQVDKPGRRGHGNPAASAGSHRLLGRAASARERSGRSGLPVGEKEGKERGKEENNCSPTSVGASRGTMVTEAAGLRARQADRDQQDTDGTADDDRIHTAGSVALRDTHESGVGSAAAAAAAAGEDDNTDAESGFPCPCCPATFSTSEELILHVEIHVSDDLLGSADSTVPGRGEGSGASTAASSGADGGGADPDAHGGGAAARGSGGGSGGGGGGRDVDKESGGAGLGSCLFCNVMYPISELEAHVNKHMDEEEERKRKEETKAEAAAKLQKRRER